MSRSKPQNTDPNPARTWFEWNGEAGTIRYYDKEQKKNIDLGSDFRFMLLDQLGTVRGWDDTNECGIYANEVRDTRQEALIVKSFKGGILVEGVYKDIKDRVKSLGGQFVANCYIAFKGDEPGLIIGALQFKGAALKAWMDFCKEHRAQLYTSAIHIKGYTEGKKGRIVFRVPKFAITGVSNDTQTAAMDLDIQLQTWLDAYLARTTKDRVEHAPQSSPQSMPDDEVPPPWEGTPADEDMAF